MSFMLFRDDLLVELEEGDHFWGTCVSEDLMVFGIINGDIYVCGNWEGDFDSKEIKFIQKINKPKNK